jgi:hypothetical protein
MTALARRLLIVVVAAGMLLLAVHAVAPLSIAGSERYLLIGTAAGMALAGLWLWSDWGLLIAAEAAAISLGLLTQVIPASGPGRATGVTAGSTVTLAPAGVIALTVATVCLAALCGWLVTARRTPWPVVALAGSMFLVRANVTRVYEDRFPLFMVAAVALVALVYSPTLRRLWLALPASLLALALIGVTWQLPAARHTLPLEVVDPLAGLATTGAPGLEGNQLPLHGAFHPSDRPVMSVRTDEPALRPYWRMSVFDTYDGHGWDTEAVTARPTPAASWLPGSSAADVFTHVRLLEPARALVSAGQPVAASIDTAAIYAAGSFDPVRIESLVTLPAGTEYEVAGSLAGDASEPAGALSADLQLPSEPARIAILAHSLVRGQRDPLGRALAIESYLRDSGRFQYDVNAGSSARGDAVDDFLFHSRRGYCNQFASALVVLARSAGIPARLVTGYATGAPEGDAFLVRERDAHSWSEVYTQTGWVQLDPTPGFNPDPSAPPGLNLRPSHAFPPYSGRPSSMPRVPRLRSTPRVAASGRHPGSPAPVGSVVGGIAAGLLLLAGIAYTLRPRSLDELYRGLVRSAPRRYGRLDLGDTPLEFAERFRPALEEYDDVRYLAELYARKRYAGLAPSAEELQAARRAWLRLRRRWVLRRAAR